MSEQSIEKSLLYFLLLSLLVHGLLFAYLTLLPPAGVKPRSEPVMVELEDIPAVQHSPSREPATRQRVAPQRQRVRRETAPPGTRERDRIARLPALPERPVQQPPPVPPLQQNRQPVAPERALPSRPEQRGEGLLRRPGERNTPPVQLFPSAGRMAKLEESYRKKYGPEVTEGETKFLDTDDILFGSFLRRFETAVYGVWRYPPDAARLGIEGITPVRITFNRSGVVEHVELMESSGSKILDDEVLRTLRSIGPVGPFPRSYDKDQFKLIAFFQYGIVRGAVRGTLH